MTIRPFVVDDFAAAHAHWARTPGVALTDADSPEAIARYLRRNAGLSFVAEDEGLLVGTILCGHDGRRGFIHHLVVAPSHRRRGLATRLLDAGVAALRGEGMTKAHLMVFRSNEDGLAFWRARGVGRDEIALFSVEV
ncbi:MAG: GNAT family N-acetyltransferase [Vicinamibacterales bacterium]